MFSTKKKLPNSQACQEKISILVVSPHQDDFCAIRRVLHIDNWNVARASDLRSASKYVSEECPEVVICEKDLPDGSWKEVIKLVKKHGKAPAVIVASRHADEGLWSEVLNLGGYDVLTKPFERSELIRVVSTVESKERWSEPVPDSPLPLAAAAQFA